MNWKPFFAMLQRDAHVARRNFLQFLMQIMLQPLLFVFVFGRVLVFCRLQRPPVFGWSAVETRGAHVCVAVGDRPGSL